MEKSLKHTHLHCGYDRMFGKDTTSNFFTITQLFESLSHLIHCLPRLNTRVCYETFFVNKKPKKSARSEQPDSRIPEELPVNM